MSKLACTLALTIALASASTTFAFAAAPSMRALSQGSAIDRCRDELFPQGGVDDHHKRPQIEACVQRVEHGQQATTYEGGRSYY